MPSDEDQAMATVDPEIDRVGRSSRSFDIGVELSRKRQRKLS